MLHRIEEEKKGILRDKETLDAEKQSLNEQNAHLKLAYGGCDQIDTNLTKVLEVKEELPFSKKLAMLFEKIDKEYNTKLGEPKLKLHLKKKRSLI